MSHQSGEEEYSIPSNGMNSFIHNPLPAEETECATISESQSTFPSQLDHPQDAQFEEGEVEDGSLCNNTRIEVCALVIGSASLAEVYRKYRIRWKFCKRCGAKDESQDAFESELVLGVDLCLVCSAIEQQRKKIKDHHRGMNDSTYTVEDNHTATLSIAALVKDCYTSDSREMTSAIPESNPHTASARLIIDGKDYYTNNQAL